MTEQGKTNQRLIATLFLVAFLALMGTSLATSKWFNGTEIVIQK